MYVLHNEKLILNENKRKYLFSNIINLFSWINTEKSNSFKVIEKNHF